MLPVKASMNILVPPLRGLVLECSGKLQPGFDIVRRQDRLLTEFSEVDVPSMEGTLDGLDAGLDLGCLAEDCQRHRVLRIGLHHGVHRDVVTRRSTCAAVSALERPCFFRGTCFTRSQDRLVTAKTRSDLGWLGAFRVPLLCEVNLLNGQWTSSSMCVPWQRGVLSAMHSWSANKSTQTRLQKQS